MSIEKLQQQKEDQDFYSFLSRTADNWANSESQKQSWISYVTDQSRGEELAQKLVNSFALSDRERRKVLDVGCGFGSLLIALQKRFGQVCGLDYEEKCVEWSQKRAAPAQVVRASATEIPWSEREFDLVISTDVFEHIPYEEQERAVSELIRVLKPGGHGYVEVPNKLQILDEHNRLLFASWLPNPIRKKYVEIASAKQHYLRCWERTGRGWKRLFEAQGFQVELKPRYLKGLNFLKYFLLPPNRFHLYLTKQ